MESFFLWGLTTGSTEIEVQLGNREIYADLGSDALEDAEDFVADFFEAKSWDERPSRPPRRRRTGG